MTRGFQHCPTDAVTPGLCSNGSAVFVDLDAGKVRVYCTTVIKMLGVLVTLAGTLAIKRFNQRQVVKDKHTLIPLHKISSWLSPTQVATYAFKARRVPGGRWGFLMLLAGIYSLLADYSVNVFVTQVDYAGICSFNQGVIMSNQNYLTPEISWAASQYSLNSQNTSYANRMALASQGQSQLPDGMGGIYAKATNNQSFYALDHDILGGWQCNFTKRVSGFNASSSKQLHDQAKKDGIIPEAYNASFWTLSGPGYNVGSYYDLKGVLVFGVENAKGYPAPVFGMAIDVDNTDDEDFSLDFIQCQLHDNNNPRQVILPRRSKVHPLTDSIEQFQWNST